MKKTNFLKGLAAIVLGCMFTSCEKENLSATFQAGPAEVTLNVDVFDALSGTDVTSKATITVSNAEFIANGTAQFATGVKAQTVSVTATLGEGTATAEVAINSTMAGGKANYNVKLIIADGLKTTTTTLGTSEETVFAKFESLSYDATHTHDGITGWYSNATDYFQPYTVEYEVVESAYKNTSELEKTAVYGNLDEVYAAAIQSAYENIVNAKATSETATLEGKASAWSYFNVFVTVTTTNYKWTAATVNSEEVVATFTYDAISSTEAESVEIAHPNHAGHYQQGHGINNNSNAGGGFAIAE
jgi:hypothetical protein